jgi:hypothetical protein
MDDIDIEPYFHDADPDLYEPYQWDDDPSPYDGTYSEL